MHYILVWWFKERVQPALKGFSGLVVYADDFVVCFQYKHEAEAFYELLKKRMRYFGLEMEESKTRLVEFGRYAARDRKQRGEGKPETFTFLGFTHFCSTGKNGWYRVKRKTSRKKFAKKCREINKIIRDMRTWKLLDFFKRVNQILVGYYHYYGITDNYRSLSSMKHRVEGMIYYWLNRRSQKKSYTWAEFHDLLRYFPLAEPKIYTSVYS